MRIVGNRKLELGGKRGHYGTRMRKNVRGKRMWGRRRRREGKEKGRGRNVR